MQTLFYALAVLVIFFLFFFPFIHVGGNYYRGMLLIWHKYTVINSSWIMSSSYNWLEIVWWADPLTFTYIEADYAKDRNYVYTGQRLDNSDPNTFRVVPPLFSRSNQVINYYVDKNNVRWGGVLQMKIARSGDEPESFDSGTFVPIGSNFIGDKTGVYYRYQRMDYNDRYYDISEKNRYDRNSSRIDIYERADIADPSTFTVVSESFEICIAKDKNFVYRKSINTGINLPSTVRYLVITENVGEKSFEDLGSYYYKTSNGIFWCDKQIYEADIESFRVIKMMKNNRPVSYAKDKNHVYFGFRVLTENERITFEKNATLR